MVSLVTHKQIKKDYAAKMIDRSLCDNEELAKEVAIMQEIEEHPGVIHLKDVYEEPGSSKFVLILELYVTPRERITWRDIEFPKTGAKLIYTPPKAFYFECSPSFTAIPIAKPALHVFLTECCPH